MVTPELRDLLADLGAVPANQDPAGITIQETVTLEKFDGDDGPVVERIVIDTDGAIIEHWKRGSDGTD